MKTYNLEKILKEGITLKKDNEEINISIKKIEIPKIQRDYAQGRDSTKEIRNLFINAIFKSLLKNEIMEMDFVYGSIDEINKIFTPLDGQQRLTTLFLLYWYIGTRELDKSRRDDLYGLLEKFTYETRITSRRFCEILCNKTSETIISFKDKPSEEIMDLPWFFRAYKQDPTIKSMLNMLDAIHDKYDKENKKLFSTLEKLQFYILPLNDFNLSDELYVRMNARGKQLTDFENFKADLIKWMKDKDDFYEKVKFNNRDMEYYFCISLKIDTEWTDFFWQITKYYDKTEKDDKGNLLHPDGKIVDPLFIRLFYRYFLQNFILTSKIDNKNMDKDSDYQFFYLEEKYQKFKEFEKLLNIEIIKKLETFLDKLKLNWKEIEKSIIPSWEDKWTFLNEKITLKERVVFLAISLFLQENNFNNIQFKKWMRIVWNIVENANINSAETMIGVMKLINELSLNAHRIYDFLANGEKINSDSSKNVIKEERTKARFIDNSEKREEEIISAEEHQFFKGAINFIINENMTIEEFRHRKEMAFKVFNKKGINDEYKNNHLFLRALISRYTDQNIIDQYFTDKDKEEDLRHLKNMLVSEKNEDVRKATREWFSLKSEEELKNALNKSVENDSKIQKWNDNNEQEKPRLRRAHEALYKVPEIQDWMQETGSIRFDYRYNHLYISKHKGWEHHWIMLETCRNEVIEQLIKNGFRFKMGTEHRVKDKIPFFWGFNIEVFGEINGKEYKITFDHSNKIKVEINENGEWKEIKTDDYNDYVEKDIDPDNLLVYLSKL